MQLKSQISPELFQRRNYCNNWRTLPHCTILLSLLLHLFLYHLKSVQKQGCQAWKIHMCKNQGWCYLLCRPTANPTHTAPADPLSIVVALILSPYPPPPGLPPLPVTDHPNALLDVLLQFRSLLYVVPLGSTLCSALLVDILPLRYQRPILTSFTVTMRL
jgi:hypothetical protein